MVRQSEAELVKWLRSHAVPLLFEEIASLLLRDKPSNPMKYLLENQKKWCKSETTTTEEKPKEEEQKQIVFVVRHGHRIDDFDSSWKDTTDRPYDPPLTDEGIKAAGIVGTELSEFPSPERPSHVVSSPFIRCVQTAVEISKKLQLSNVHINYRIGEIHSEQVLKHATAPEYEIPDEIDGIKINKDNTGICPPFPEERPEAFDRYSEAFATVPNKPYKNMVLVSHGEVRVLYYCNKMLFQNDKTKKKIKNK